MSEQDWERGRRLAIAKALREAIYSDFKHEGSFSDTVYAWIGEFWPQPIKPYPTRGEIREIMDILVAALEAEEASHE